MKRRDEVRAKKGSRSTNLGLSLGGPAASWGSKWDSPKQRGEKGKNKEPG